MLKNRVVSTLKFFDLQDYPLTLLELGRFLLVEAEELKKMTNYEGELVVNEVSSNSAFGMDEIIECLDKECPEVEQHQGFYFLKGRRQIVDLRLQNYFYGIQR